MKSESFRVETISPLRTWNASFLLKNFKELLVLLLLIQTSLVVFAQESNKKRVVVVPCSRFEFTSEFELSEIAQKNEVTVSEIFLIYQKKMLNTFEEYSDENFEFVPIKYALIKPYKKALKTQIGKFNGKRYNQANLAGISETEFTQLLEAHQADFMVFVTWYDIQKESYTKDGRASKRVPYAGHYFDYDVLNLFKQRVVGEGRVKAKGLVPNDEQAKYSLLRTKELTGVYNNFIAHIIAQLSKPIE